MVTDENGAGLVYYTSGGSRPRLSNVDECPRPFTLRIAVKRFVVDEAPGSEGNRHLIFSRRAGLTGSLALTDAGQDLDISDVDIQ
jgi:hypothetical protein